MTTEPQVKGPTKAQKRLERRIRNYERIIKMYNGRYETSMTRPGSMNKPYPGGRKK